MHPCENGSEGQIVRGMCDQVRDVLIRKRVLAELGADIAAKATRVIVQSRTVTNVSWKGSVAVDRAEVDGHVCERAIIDAATARPGGEGDDERGNAWHGVDVRTVRDGDAVPRYGERRAGEEGGIGWVLSILRPVPIPGAGKG